MSKQNSVILRAAAAVFTVVALAFVCRRIVLTTDNVFLEQLANFVRICLYLGLFSAWGVTVYRRVVQLQVRRYLVAVSVLMVSWLTVREFRWHLILDAAVRRYLWYAYYIPLTLIPLLALFVSMSLGKSEKFRLPRWTASAYLPTFLLIALVLTNNLHQLVFRFPADAAAWAETDYAYGPVFYVLSAWAALCALAAFVIMLAKSRIPRTKKMMWLPLVLFGIAVVYIVLYAVRVPFIMSVLGDLTVFDCLVFTAFLESCIQCGLIQSNSRYSDLFRASEDISAQITDKAYTVRYAASGAVPIPKEDMLRAEAAPVILPSKRRLHSMAIRGGHAVWTEEIGALLSLRETLKDRQEELRERNDFLRMEYAQEKEYRSVMEQNRLYDLLQSKTQAQLDQIRDLAAAYQSAADAGEKRRILSRVVVLGSYIKRRKDFVLSMEGASAMPESKLTSAFGESFYSLELLNIRGVYLVRTGQRHLPGEILVLAYDFFEAVLEAVLDSARYLNAIVSVVDGAPRCAIQTDGVCDAGALRRNYPGMRLVPDGDGGTEYILPLTGGGNA